MRRWGALALILLLGSCGGRIVPPGVVPAPVSAPLAVRQPVAAVPIAARPASTVAGAATAFAAGVLAGPALSSLPISEAQATRALAAFRLSCPALLRRTDLSGLTRASDWIPACTTASQTRDADARAFFGEAFEPVQIGDGRAFATGYFEPEIAGSRQRAPGYDVPIYGRPDDLIEVDLGQFADDLKGRKVRGRVDGSALVPYFDRAEIEQGAIGKRAPIIAWAADAIDIFFLQIQGSGRLRLPDGSVMRIGYQSQNGRPYTGIGALLRERGLLQPGQASMQGIVAWLRANPEEGRAIMRENKSFVFFREQQGSPRGALGVPVTGGVSAAADPNFVPLGAPVFLSLDRADATGLWVAQDTGGAIRGANRFDTFWGAGDEARAIAGGMSARGTAILLLPTGTLARLTAERAARGGAAVKP